MITKKCQHCGKRWDVEDTEDWKRFCGMKCLRAAGHDTGTVVLRQIRENVRRITNQKRK